MRIFLTYFLIFLGVMITLASPAQPANLSGINESKSNPDHPRISLKAGEYFSSARLRLIKAGWKPLHMHQNDNYEYSGTEVELADHGFHEIDSCTTDAGSLCTFYYFKTSECLRLDTIGEQLKDIRVTYWKNECPSEKSWYVAPNTQK
jgi:hypothetical protein